MSEQCSKIMHGGDEMGMSDAQFKAYLLEQLENWQQVYDLASEDNNPEIRTKIEKINMALKF